MNPINASLKIEFSPAWAFINDVRRFVEGFCHHASVPPDIAQAASTATHELLQNAIRYSVNGRAGLSLEVNAEKSEIRITAENDAPPDRVAGLRKISERMLQETDSESFYLSLMKETVGKDGSGLGLGRIRYECDMKLGITINDTHVKVSAWGPLKGDSPA